MGAKWVPSLYCIGNTLLQGMFCLGEISLGLSLNFFLSHTLSHFSGMIYRMDPFAMPRGFCIGRSQILRAMVYHKIHIYPKRKQL